MTEPVGQQPRVVVRRSSERFTTTAPGRTTRHSFSFGAHYDPAEVGLGFLVCHNDDRVMPGHGYPPHPHRDLEIVTWVMTGALRHEDSTGRGGIVVPGVVQRLRAGSGVVHTEVTEGPDPVHFIQMWVLPDEPGGTPDYGAADVTSALHTSDWVTLASGRPSPGAATAVRLGNSRSALHVSRLAAGGTTQLPDAPLLHVFVTHGTVELEPVDDGGRLGKGDTGLLEQGDAAKLFGTGGLRVTAATPTELLVWEMHPS